jgi:thioredoxin 2
VREVKLVKVDIDESPVIAERFDARGIPMLLVLHRGQKISDHVGAAPEQTLRLGYEIAGASTRHAPERAG